MIQLRFSSFRVRFNHARSIQVRLVLVILTVSACLFPASTLQARQAVYEAWPQQQVRFHQAVLDVTINRNATRISGTVRYEVSPFTSNTPEIVLQGRSMTVTGADLDGSPLDVDQSGRIIRIDTDSRMDPGSRYQLTIAYEATPGYGIHVNQRGTVWTSNMPETTSAWVPSFDSPFVAMPVDFSFTIPEGLELVTVGEFIGSEPSEEGSTRIRWASNTPVAVSGWNFAFGDLRYQEAIAGIKPVRIYSEPGTLNANDTNGLLRHLSDAMGRTQRLLNMEFPFDGMSLLVLADHRWEEKSFAPGYGYVYQNMGDLMVQADRAVMHQWFGARHRSYDMETATVHEAYAARLFGELRSGEAILNYADFPTYEGDEYSFYGPAVWNRVTRAVEMEADDLMFGLFRQTYRDAARLPSGVYDLNAYNRFWYDQIGTTFNEVNLGIEMKTEAGPVFEIEITETESDGTVTFKVTPIQNVPDSVITITVHLTRPDSVEDAGFELDPAGSVITRSVDPSLQNITFSADASVELAVYKPFRFWLHQLRRSEDAAERAAAAEVMAFFTDDPDLQLALSDIIRNEQDPAVRAGLVRAMAALTGGASGTEQMFMNFLREDPVRIRLAALEALAGYPGKEEVQRMTGRTVQTAPEPEVAITALRSLRLISSETDFRDFVRSLMVSDRKPAVKAAALEELFMAVDLQDAIALTDPYLSGSQPYAVRETAFRLIAANAAPEKTETVIRAYTLDRDPRIRYIALKAASELFSETAYRELLETRRSPDPDPRVENSRTGEQ
ncbi:MAG: HEAT repeat domain-containing protein [Cyclonatronaceae bacterium]